MGRVEGLSVDEAGAVLGLFAGLSVSDAGAAVAAAARLRGAVGARCQEAVAALAGLGGAERAAELSALGAAAGAVPAGLEHAHPGWAPAPLPPGDAPDWLRRAAHAGLAPMDVDEGWPALEDVERRGAELVGRALVGAPAEAVARAAAAVGEPLARVVLAGVGAASGSARDAARALVAEVPPAEARAGLPRAVGLRALARELATRSPAARAAAAQRLPPAEGVALLALVAGVE